MGEGGDSRWIYSAGLTGAGENTDPTESLGGDSPDPVGAVLVERFRGSEIACESNWNANPTIRSAGQIAAVLTNGNISAAAGDWLLAIEQNSGDSGSFLSSNDARGSYAKILTMSASTNQSAPVNITLDRELTGLAVSGDNVRISKAQNVFRNVTDVEAIAGIVDHSMLWFYKNDSTTSSDTFDNVELWIDPVQANGCKIEIMRPENLFNPTLSQNNFDNELATRFVTPFNSFGSALLENAFFNEAGPPIDIVSQSLAIANATFRQSSVNVGFPDQCTPVWLRRTIPAGTRPAECVFILRNTSTTGFIISTMTDNVALTDFNKLNSGAIIVWSVAQSAVRVISLSIDRRIYPGGGCRITGTLVNGTGVPLPNRWFNITVSAGTVVQTATAFSSTAGQIVVTYALPLASPPATVTISASLVDPA